jgi:hypothetical protein
MYGASQSTNTKYTAMAHASRLLRTGRSFVASAATTVVHGKSCPRVSAGRVSCSICADRGVVRTWRVRWPQPTLAIRPRADPRHCDERRDVPIPDVHLTALAR